MKKFYVAPELEEMEMEMEDTILAESDFQGGGIGDDNSTEIDTTPSDDPNDDFGW